MKLLLTQILTSCKGRYTRSCLALLALCICALSASAQQAVVTLDRSQILLGEQVTVQLKVENVTHEVQDLSQWFQLPHLGNHIEVIRREKIDTIQIDRQTTYIQKITITSFDSGRWTIPIIDPIIKDVNNQSYTLSTDSVYLTVLPVDVSKLKEFHPMNGIILVDYKDYTWLYIVGGVLVLVLLIIFAIWWKKRHKKRSASSTQIIQGPPLEWALKEIDVLEKEQLVAQGKVKEFFTRLNDICKAYYDERTDSHTRQSTSIEMMERLQRFLIKEKDRTALRGFAQLSDRVKFAEHHPDEARATQAADTARETLRNIEKQVIDLNKNNDH